jgi:AcrR family transcriptional regulator
MYLLFSEEVFALAKKQTNRQLRSEQTKLNLFNSAVGLLAEKPFEEITIREIVAKAGLSVGTFYNYYNTKMDVFYQAYNVADRYFADTVAPQLKSGTARERIFLFFDYYARYSSEISGLKLTRLLYSVDNPHFMRNAPNGMIDTLIGVLQYGLTTGEFITRGDTVREMADFFMICMRGVVYNWCTANGSYDLSSVISRFTSRALYAYQA